MHAVKQERYLRVLCTVSDGESSSSSSVCYTFPCLIAPLSLSRLLYVAGKNSAAAAAPPNGSFSLLAHSSPLSVLSPFLCATTQSFSDSERRKAKQQPAAEAKSAAAVLLVSYLLLSVSLQAAPKKSAKKEEIVCKQKCLSKDKREDDLLPSLFLFFPLTLPAWCCYFFSVCVSARINTRTDIDHQL